MDQKSDLIREDIDQTRSELTEKLVNLEDQLRDKVDSAKETVEGTIENVRTTLRKFSPSHQVQQHPFATTAGAVAAGLLVGKVIGDRRVPSLPNGIWDRNYGAWGKQGAALGLPNLPQTSEYEVTHARTIPHVPQGPSTLSVIFSKLTDTFSDEIDMLKGMAVGYAIDAARQYAKKSLPEYSPQIDKVLDSAMVKVGGEHIGPFTESEKGHDQTSQPPLDRAM